MKQVEKQQSSTLMDQSISFIQICQKRAPLNTQNENLQAKSVIL